jgi:hypothetical protein
MKKSIFYTVLLLVALIVGAASVFAGEGGPAEGEILAASSDCESVTVRYTITESGIGIWFVGAYNGKSSNMQMVAPFPGTNTVTIKLASEPEEDIVVVLGNLLFEEILVEVDDKTIQCDEDATEVTGEPPRFTDGRLQPFATDRVIYPDAELGIIVRDPNGLVELFIPMTTILGIGVPDQEPHLLAETADGYVQIYRLPDGRYQANVGPDAEGKVHVVRWVGLGIVPAWAVENSTFMVR